MEDHQKQDDRTRPSQWRLVSLALGLAAIVNILGSFVGLTQLLRPTRWLLAQWLSDGSLTAVSPLAVQVMRLGIDLWLLASVLIVTFWVTGLHRKLLAPRRRVTSLGINLMWLTWVALSFVPYFVGQKYGHGEGASALMFVIGVYAMPIILLLSLWSSVAIASEVKTLVEHTVSFPPYLPKKLLAWAVIPPVMSMLPVLLDPSEPLTQTAKANDEFKTLCKGVGVQFLEKPVAPVHSIAYDFDPKRISGWSGASRVELDEDGRTLGFGGFSKRNSAEATKVASFKFTERRAGDGAGAATINPSAPYYYFPAFSAQQPYYGVDNLSADILAFLDVDKPDELSKAPIRQGAIRYQITLTDRRSGAVLGVQVFVVDRLNHRACGVNVDNVISPDAFIFEAINR